LFSPLALSILDLIGDDDATTASEGNPAHEAHVAFSIEGVMVSHFFVCSLV